MSSPRPFLLRALVLAVAPGLAAACAEPTEVTPGVCGNLVTEAGEQCDGQDDCGVDGEAACRYTCAQGERACPGDLACSVDGVCVASAGRFVPFDVGRRYELAADRIVVGDLDGDRRDDLIGVGDAVRVRFGSPDEPLLASYEKAIRPPTGAAAFGELDDRPGLDLVFPTATGVFTLLARGRELEAVPYASTAALPDDGAAACAPSPGWATCRTIDLDRDGRLDRVGFVADRDNLAIELGRAAGPSVAVTIDTLDVITDVAVGDFDGDGYGDIGFATRSVDGAGTESAAVVYGAPQPSGFTRAPVLTADRVRGVAAADLDAPPDGLADLAIDRVDGATAGVALYLGDAARDLSAPFRLDGSRADLDVPYAVVAGEFVGGVGSGIDVMAYARNPAEPDRAYLWWLRGVGAAQLELGAVDPVDVTDLAFVDNQWRVADLVTDDTTGNGPDEVIGLSPRAPDCAGPALTAAVPSARFTPGPLLRSACLGLDEPGWSPALIGLVEGVAGPRAVALAQRAETWWLGEATRLDDATMTGRLGGATVALPAGCRDPQLWAQTPEAGTFVSWLCDQPDGSEVLALRATATGAATPTAIATVPPGAAHLTGDWNGDGLTDVVIRQGRALTVLLQCSTDMVGTTPGC